LVSHEARVYVGARSEDKAQAVISEINKDIPGADIHFLKLDLSSLQSVQDAAKELQRFANTPCPVTFTRSDDASLVKKTLFMGSLIMPALWPSHFRRRRMDLKSNSKQTISVIGF
jgi:hypothetical protein